MKVLKCDLQGQKLKEYIYIYSVNLVHEKVNLKKYSKIK